ncbi:MAG: hypothetical protein KDA22_14375 [Phycisphaerales bacterium]|nr:hypothetical protein [Phycisphaerales bacterium]
MSALLAKEFRLSLDVLRPWALVVVGAIIFALVARRLPESILPVAMAQLTIGDLMSAFAVAVGGSAVIVSAWSAAAILQGDQSHGAALLAASLPVAPRELAASKVLVLAFAVLVPAVAATVAFALARAANPVAESSSPLSIGLFAVLISAAGAGLAMPWALLVRGSSKVVFLAMSAAIAFGAAGALGASIIHLRLVRAAVKVFAEPGQDAMGTAPLALAGERARLVAIAAGIGVAALIGLVIGVAAIGRSNVRRWIPWALVAALAAAFGVGIAAARIAIDRDEAFWRSGTGTLMRASRLDDTALAQEIRSWDAARRRNMWAVPGDLATFAEEGARRMSVLSPSMRASSPVLQALVAAQAGASRDLAECGVLLLPSGDKSRRDAALDGVIRFPESTWMQWILSRELALLPGAPPSDRDDSSVDVQRLRGWGPIRAEWKDPFRIERRRSISAALLVQLEWWLEHGELDRTDVQQAIARLRSEQP